MSVPYVSDPRFMERADNPPAVANANQWPFNLGSKRSWGFQDQPDSYINGRSIPFSMGKVLGGGSSINVMVWARPQAGLGWVCRRGV